MQCTLWVLPRHIRALVDAGAAAARGADAGGWCCLSSSRTEPSRAPRRARTPATASRSSWRSTSPRSSWGSTPLPLSRPAGTAPPSLAAWTPHAPSPAAAAGGSAATNSCQMCHSRGPATPRAAGRSRSSSPSCRSHSSRPLAQPPPDPAVPPPAAPRATPGGRPPRSAPASPHPSPRQPMRRPGLSARRPAPAPRGARRPAATKRCRRRRRSRSNPPPPPPPPPRTRCEAPSPCSSRRAQRHRPGTRPQLLGRG